MITLRNRKPHQPNTILDPFFFGNNYAPVVKSNELNSRIFHNILKEENQFIIEIAAPGFEKKNFGIDVVDNTLIISLNTKKAETEETEKADVQADEKYIRKEFRFDDFKKKFTLPNDTNKEAISASYENGILNVFVPIKEKITRQVSIK